MYLVRCVQSSPIDRLLLSATNHVPAATYATAFVLMVLAMITIRTVAVIARAHQAGADLRLSDSKRLRRLHHA
jgi:hypothetical protein